MPNRRLGVIELNNSTKMGQGVGVQILDGESNPFSLVVEKSLGNKNGSFTISFKARYMQINSTVGPGLANATATFTVSYN